MCTVLAYLYQLSFLHHCLRCREKQTGPGSVNAAHPAKQDSTQAGKSIDEFGCTTLFINSKDVQLILHNEDCDPLIKACGYLLSADIEEEGRREKFTSFCYPGTLPGQAFNFNEHGVVFTSNILCPGKIALPPYHF